MRVNEAGYTLDYRHQCSAWTINNQGRHRKQCGLPVHHTIDDWVYFCSRHYELVTRSIERGMDTLHTRRMANMQERLDLLEDVRERFNQQDRELDESMRRIEQRPTSQTVYYMRCQKFIKIGISKDPMMRLHQIQNGGGTHFPRLLDIATTKLVATEPGGMVREKEMHAKFSHLRHTGEWFTETPELTAHIKSVMEAKAT